MTSNLEEYHTESNVESNGTVNYKDPYGELPGSFHEYTNNPVGNNVTRLMASGFNLLRNEYSKLNEYKTYQLEGTSIIRQSASTNYETSSIKTSATFVSYRMASNVTINGKKNHNSDKKESLRIYTFRDINDKLFTMIDTDKYPSLIQVKQQGGRKQSGRKTRNRRNRNRRTRRN